MSLMMTGYPSKHVGPRLMKMLGFKSQIFNVFIHVVLELALTSHIPYGRSGARIVM
jgi:hypothetical protein